MLIGHVTPDKEAVIPMEVFGANGLVQVEAVIRIQEALAVEVGMRQRELWLAENREAIQAYNEHVTQHGVFSAGLRGF